MPALGRAAAGPQLHVGLPTAHRELPVSEEDELVRRVAQDDVKA